ncbi:MAG: NADPH-dependent F420 reductase [Candidatus Hydrothermarchaeota archaeon]
MIAIIGGTGKQGMGLAMRFCIAGERVIIGSRNAEKAKKASEIIKEKIKDANVIGLTNEEATERGDIIIVSVPYKALKNILKSIKPFLKEDHVVVDVTVPLDGDISESASEMARKILPHYVKLVSAFKNASAKSLLDTEKPVDSDIIVCGDDKKSKEKIMELAEKIDGVRAIDGGSLKNSRIVEGITSLLMDINKRYKGHAGIRITGIQ